MSAWSVQTASSIISTTLKATAAWVTVMSKTIYVDNTIYRKESKQFPNVKYRFNLANVVIHSMYTMYLKSRGIPKTIGLTDKQRFDFEKRVQSLIDNGSIIVTEEV